MDKSLDILNNDVSVEITVTNQGSLGRGSTSK